MKKVIPFLCILVCFISFSCNNALLPSPVIKSGSGGDSGGSPSGSGQWGAPANPKASHGYKRKITLSWDSVKNAERYLIYKSDSPLSDFVQCAETADSSTSFTFSVSDGTSLYYKVAAVNRIGETSPMSFYVRGTSLAQPVISDVQESQDVIGAAVVYWYMNNAETSTYQREVRYTVYCFEGNTEKSRVLVDGSASEKTEAVFYNLSPSTNYSYQVEAYNVSDQNAATISEKMDAATARRLRPSAVYNLQAGRGTDKNSITLSFILPDMTDVSVGNNTYEQHPIYFEISRKKAGTQDSFEIVCPYFGVDSVKAASKGEKAQTFAAYFPGTMVSWSDTTITDANRGVEYEYKVQSYVDNINRIISSNSSVAYATGWAMSKPSIGFQTTRYTLSGDQSAYVSAILPLTFSHNTKGINYTYNLTETIDPLPYPHANNPDGQITNSYTNKDGNWVSNYAAEIDLTRKTTQTSKGRGFYSYQLTVLLNGSEIETVNTIGSRLISEDTETVKVENFNVEDGYPDKFIISWDRDSNKKYFLKFSSTGSAPWQDIKTFDFDPSANGGTFKYTHISGNGVSGYFSIYAENDIGKTSDTVVTDKKSSMTVPSLSGSGADSYKEITLEWNPVEKADFYRVEYTYSTAAYARTIMIDASTLSPNSFDLYSYKFTPYDYDNAQVAGAPVSIRIDALNKARELINGDNVEVKTTSNTIIASLVGPARTNPRVNANYETSKIILSWDQVSGASGYYILRRYEKKANNTSIMGNPVLYYVDINDLSKVKGKDLMSDSYGTPVDTYEVFADLSYSLGKFSLTDNYVSDTVFNAQKTRYSASYIEEQNELAWGNPYHYYVIPVLSEDHRPSLDGGYIKTSSISYRNHSTLERKGYTTGFAVDISATKGTGSSGSAEGFPINDIINITWNRPSHISGTGITYDIYRRKDGDTGSWIKLNSVPLEDTFYADKNGTQNPPAKGIAYEYLVKMLLNGSALNPYDNARYVTSLRNFMDDHNTSESRNKGFILQNPKIISASRTELGNASSGYYELVKWYASGVEGNSHNRGVSGYEIQVLNKNLGSSWITLMQVPMTAANDAYNFEAQAANTNNLLKVLRDYKHYFRIRAYAVDYRNDGETIIYSEFPGYTWQDSMDTDYITWGARQITPEEFAKAASLAMSIGLKQINSTAWNTGFFTRNKDADSPGSGNIYAESNFGVTDWTFKFTNYKPPLATKGGTNVTLMTLNGTLKAATNLTNQYPRRYNNNGSYITVTGPSGLGMYSGLIKFDGLTKTSTGGAYVKYPSTAAEQQFGNGVTPFPYYSYEYLNDEGDWQ